MAISSKNNHQYYYLEEINSHSRTTVYLRKGKNIKRKKIMFRAQTERKEIYNDVNRLYYFKSGMKFPEKVYWFKYILEYFQ